MSLPCKKTITKCLSCEDMSVIESGNIQAAIMKNFLYVKNRKS